MKGILTDQLNMIYECTDLATCRMMAFNIVNASDIRAQDKCTMIHNMNACDSLIKLQTYLTNSWFAFNKMRVK